MHTITSLVAAEPGYAPSHDPEELEETQRRMRLSLETLPRRRYPRIVEAAAPLSICDDPNADYAFGLDLLIGGIEAIGGHRE